jgi:hypothetical protein
MIKTAGSWRHSWLLRAVTAPVALAAHVAHIPHWLHVCIALSARTVPMQLQHESWNAVAESMAA